MNGDLFAVIDSNNGEECVRWRGGGQALGESRYQAVGGEQAD